MEGLVEQLEEEMKRGNYTGGKLEIVKTLMDHINLLEDRIHGLQGMIQASCHRIKKLENRVGKADSDSSLRFLTSSKPSPTPWHA